MMGLLNDIVAESRGLGNYEYLSLCGACVSVDAARARWHKAKTCKKTN